MFVHKFSGKKNIFCLPCKKDNFCCSKHDYSQDIFFCLFYIDHIKCLFPRKLVGEYRMSICTREILFRNVLTFLNFVFPAFYIIGSYAPYMPKHHSCVLYSYPADHVNIFLLSYKLLYTSVQHLFLLSSLVPLVENGQIVPARKRLLSRLGNRDNGSGTKGPTFCPGPFTSRDI
jgi:hypothetical protein